MKLAWRLVVLATLALSPGVAEAQSALRPCLDELLAPQARVEVCTRLIETIPGGFPRARSLFGRAKARLEIIDAAAGHRLRADYDAALADLDLSYSAFRSEPTLVLRAVVRFLRGDVAPQALPFFHGTQYENAEQVLGALIAAAPVDVDLLLVRSTIRTILGNAEGAQQDRQIAVRIASQLP